MTHTRVEPATTAILDAVSILGYGNIVAFPTETVYGLGADARSADAVAKIYTAKGRPPGNPLIVHVTDLEAAGRYAEFSDVAIALAKQFWPGPLTLVLPRKDTITPLVSAGRSTVAIRVPKHPVAEALLNLLDGPIAAPSANRSTFTSPTTAQHVYAELNGRIPLILDGGPCTIGLESTVLDLTTSPPTLLRPGAITAEMLRDSIGPIQQFSGTVPQDQSTASPGLHERHYAPCTAAYRFNRSVWPSLAAALQKTMEPSILLSHDPAIHAHPPHETIRLPADAAAYARVFYAALRDADSRNFATLFILNPDNEQDLWLAITDRLRRATMEWAS